VPAYSVSSLYPACLICLAPRHLHFERFLLIALAVADLRVIHFFCVQVDIEVILLSIVVLSQLIDTIAVIFWICVFKSSKRVDEDGSSQSSESNSLNHGPINGTGHEVSNTANAFWEKQLRFLCKSAQICTCNIFGGSKVESDLEAVARVFTLFFSDAGLLDVVASDVVAGILGISCVCSFTHLLCTFRTNSRPDAAAEEY
jgi:hypothetical protein